MKKGAKAPEVSDEDCKKLYRGLLQVRIVDDRMMKLQRQGRLGFYMLSWGEEATHFGGAFALRDTDWIFPSYREPGAAFWRGYSLTDYVNQLFGNAEDPVKGRQMPVHHSVKTGGGGGAPDRLRRCAPASAGPSPDLRRCRVPQSW